MIGHLSDHNQHGHCCAATVALAHARAQILELAHDRELLHLELMLVEIGRTAADRRLDEIGGGQ